MRDKRSKTMFGIGLSVVLFTLSFLLIPLPSSALTMPDGSITKSFGFGPGTEFTTSNFREFAVPCGVDVKAVVSVQRGGGAAANDVDIVMELRSPGETANTEGPVVASRDVSAKILPQMYNLTGDKSTRGCNRPWIVRVKSKSAPSPVHVLGSIYVSFDNEDYLTITHGFSLDKGQTKTMNLGNSQGLGQGTLVIHGQWSHTLGIQPIKMRVELLDPDGNEVASDTGYSNQEINPCCSGNKLNLRHTITGCKPGQWKVRIKNLSEHDAREIWPYPKLKYECPN